MASTPGQVTRACPFFKEGLCFLEDACQLSHSLPSKMGLPNIHSGVGQDMNRGPLPLETPPPLQAPQKPTEKPPPPPIKKTAPPLVKNNPYLLPSLMEAIRDEDKTSCSRNFADFSPSAAGGDGTGNNGSLAQAISKITDIELLQTVSNGGAIPRTGREKLRQLPPNSLEISPNGLSYSSSSSRGEDFSDASSYRRRIGHNTQDFNLNFDPHRRPEPLRRAFQPVAETAYDLNINHKFSTPPPPGYGVPKNELPDFPQFMGPLVHDLPTLLPVHDPAKVVVENATLESFNFAAGDCMFEPAPHPTPRHNPPPRSANRPMTLGRGRGSAPPPPNGQHVPLRRPGITMEQIETPNFFCHFCKQDIPNVRPDFTCPLCEGDFIEERSTVERAKTPEPRTREPEIRAPEPRRIKTPTYYYEEEKEEIQGFAFVPPAHLAQNFLPEQDKLKYFASENPFLYLTDEDVVDNDFPDLDSPGPETVDKVIMTKKKTKPRLVSTATTVSNGDYEAEDLSSSEDEKHDDNGNRIPLTEKRRLKRIRRRKLLKLRKQKEEEEKRLKEVEDKERARQMVEEKEKQKVEREAKRAIAEKEALKQKQKIADFLKSQF